MANLATLKAALNAAIYQNNQNAITGEALNTILNSIIDTLGTGYRYAGVATPSANPGTIDNRIFYLATAAGTYTNFGAVQLDGKKLHIFIYDTTWHDIALDVPTTAFFAPHNVDWSYLISTFHPQSIENMRVTLYSTGTPASGETENDVHVAQFLGLSAQATAAEVRAVIVDIVTNKKALKGTGDSGVQMNTLPVAADNINPFVLQQNLMAWLSSTITADKCAISARYELVNGWQLILFASSSSESPYAGLFLQPRKNIFIAPDRNELKFSFVADYTADAGHALGGLNSNIQIRSAFLQGIFEYIYEDDADCGNLHKIIDTDYPVFNGNGIVRFAAYGGICRYEHRSDNTFYLGPDNFIFYTDDDLDFNFESVARPLLPPQLYNENNKKVYGINPIFAHPEVYQQLMDLALSYLEGEQGLSDVYVNSIVAAYGNIQIGDDHVINSLFAYILMWYNEGGTDHYGLFVYEI